MKVSLRIVLLAVVIVASVAIAISTFVPLYLSGEETGDSYSQSVRTGLAGRVSAEVRSFFTRYHPLVDSMSSLELFGAIDTTNEERLMRQVCDHYRRVNQSSFLGLQNDMFVKCDAFSEGFYLAQVRYVTYYNSILFNAVTMERVGSQNNIPLSKPYYPTQRPWYAAASMSKNYSRIYLNFSSSPDTPNSTVITAAGPIRNSSGALVGVFAVDVFPEDVLNYFGKIDVGRATRVLLVEMRNSVGQLNVLGSDGGSLQARLGTELISLGTVPSNTLSSEQRSAAVTAMTKCEPCETVEVEFGKRRGKGNVISTRLDTLLELRVVVVTEDKSFIGDVWERSDISIVIICVVAAVVVVVAVIVTKKTLDPLAEITSSMDDVANLTNLEAIETFSTFSEVYTLQKAFNALMAQLSQLKAFVPQNVLDDDDIDRWSFASPSQSVGDMFPDDAKQPSTAVKVEDSASPGVPSPRDGADGGRQVRWSLPEDEQRGGVHPLTAPSKAEEMRGTDDNVQLKLNTKLIGQAVNTFQLRRCSIIVAELALHRIANRSNPKEELEHVVSKFMEAIIGTAMQHRGVVQLIRPDVIVISFQMIMHETKALNAAIGMCAATSSIAKYLSLAVDSGEYYTGNCGAKERFANAVFGPMYMALRQLPDLIRNFRGTSLLVTESTIQNAKLDGFMAFPVDVLQSRFLKHPITVYDIAPVEGFGAVDCKDAFWAIQGGRLSEALTSLQRVSMQNTHSFRMLQRLEQNTSQRVRKDVFPWEDLGDLQVNPPSSVVKTFASRFDEGDAKDQDEVQGETQEEIVKKKILAARASLTASQAEERASMMDSQPEETGLGLAIFMPTNHLMDEETTNSNDQKSRNDSNTGGGDVDYDDGSLPITLTDIYDTEWQRSEKVLGEGGFGAVFQGMNPYGTLCAMKFIELQEETNLDDLETEMNVLTKLQNENLVQCYGAAVSKRHLVILLEYVPGGALNTLMAQYKNGFTPSVVKRFARDALKGLRYLHGEGVVHCDIKPHNLLVASDGTCKITDFGSAVLTGRLEGTGSGGFASSITARNMQTSGSQIGDVRGTLKYMAPEVADGEFPVDKSDIWSFGIMLCQIATGKLPWEHLPGGFNTMAFMQQVGNKKISPRIPCDVDEPLAAVIRRCWAPDAADRPSAADLLLEPFFN